MSYIVLGLPRVSSLSKCHRDAVDPWGCILLMRCLQSRYLIRVFSLHLCHLFRVFAPWSRHLVEVHLRHSLDSSTSLVTERPHSVDNDVCIFG
jgi:hypothetical protein